MSELKVFKGYSGTILKKVMSAIIPRGGAFGPGADDFDCLSKADYFVSAYNPRFRLMFPFILYYIQFTAIFSQGRLFTSLGEDRAVAFLYGFEHSRLYYKRMMVLVLKLVTMMSFYDYDEAAVHIGYRHGCHLSA